MLNPFAQPAVPAGREHRSNSSVSSASTASYLDEVVPGLASAGALADERENMRTPRPLTTTTESPKSTRIALPPEAAFVSKRKEASDATIDARDVAYQERPTRGSSAAAASTAVQATGVSQAYNAPDYATNSLGRVSNASSNYAGRLSGSEFGERPSTGSSSANRKSKKKAVAPPEVLVIVRPPPSKQVNPLNLQIQLVVPQSQSTAATSRTSLDSSREEGSVVSASISSGSNGLVNSSSNSLTPSKFSSTGLRRSSSTHSARSARSEASSGGQSYTSSSAGANRRVTPLYNLNFHNITATTVTDAGTDDKVAKFGRRTVEIDGFGQLEPHELIRGVNDLVSLQQQRRRSSSRHHPAPSGALAGSGSDLNLSEAASDIHHPRTSSVAPSAMSDAGVPALLRPQEEPPTSFDAMSPEAKNPSDGGLLGGKFLSRFKRFSINAANNANAKVAPAFSAPARAGTGGTEGSGTASLFNKMTSAAVSKMKEGGAGSTAPTEVFDDQSDMLSTRDSVLAANLQSAGVSIETPQLVVGGGLKSDCRRTEGYYWTVRRWNRRSAQEETEGGGAESSRLKEAGSNPILNSVWKRFNIVNRMGGQEIHPPCRDVPVRFEWSRNTERRKSSAVSSGHAKMATEGSITSASAGSRSANNRASSFSRASVDAREGGRGSSMEAIRANLANLKPPKSTSRPSSVYSNMSAPRRSVDATSQNGSAADEEAEMSDPEDSETVWACHLVLGPTTRIPIGSLTPAPHHPKLVGQLTIPFPLPDLSQSGLGADGAGLTREELKDIISVTCLFVVIREGFGGLVKRKR